MISRIRQADGCLPCRPDAVLDAFAKVEAMTPSSVAFHKTRHLLSHVLVAAGLRRWPQATLGDSGETPSGFYADFGLQEALADSDLAALSDEMARVMLDAGSFRDLRLTLAQALKVFERQPWKLHQVTAIAELDDSIRCYELDGVVDVCDCALKTPRELRNLHPEKFLLTGAHPVVWSHRGREILFVRVNGELFPKPLPCPCCEPGALD